MTTRMLIDARHKEETRVAVVSGNKIEELDFESAEHKQIKGNIYLAKVTRVEPSLQAAFVDYGGNRQGFLAFSEIHPDYYQIPTEDRAKLLAEEAAAAAEEAALREQEDAEDEVAASQGNASSDGEDIDADDVETFEAADSDVDTDEDDAPKPRRTRRKKSGDDEIASDDDAASADQSEEASDEEPKKKPRRRRVTKSKSMIVDDSENIVSDDEDFGDNASDASSDISSDDDDGARRNRRRRGNKGRSEKKSPNSAGRHQKARRPSDEVRAKRIALRRRYKIQDVIQRRQVLLVQVVKEERGNKGAALTSYLSLAGRYCVLMPNTSHGGGISRKINSGTDRKRLKSIVADMNLPVSMGCIIRTAGLSKTKVEIKRDFDYLARLWDKIRERTLSGAAPMLVHSDSDLIKRAIRDIYNRDITEVNIEGEEGFKAAKDFMKLLTPSHVKKLKQYTDSVPLFQRYGVEDQLNAMYHPIVQLKSGGYIVINPTEALVSIDINSGRSTKEHGIEATAVNTNLEAAREIARQLRLRDMAGLVVIDFIDMDHHSNIRKVERAMKDALRNDRARIQVGRISSFGLMEMSRQRLRTGVLEASTRECPHCEGTGLVRTSSSSALSALRMIEDEAASGKGSVIELAASEEATIYVLNNKRAELGEIEDRYHVRVLIKPNGEVEGAKMTVASTGPKPMQAVRIIPIVDDEPEEEIEASENVQEESSGHNETRPEKSVNSPDESRGRRRRGRRGGRGRNNDRNTQNEQSVTAHASDSSSVSTDNSQTNENDAAIAEAVTTDQEKAKPKRRVGRARKAPVNAIEDASSETAAAETAKTDSEEKPKRKRAPRKTAAQKTATLDAAETDIATSDSNEKPKRTRKPRVKKADTADANAATSNASGENAETQSSVKPKRTRKASTAKTPIANRGGNSVEDSVKDIGAKTGEKADTISDNGQKPKKAAAKSVSEKTAEPKKAQTGPDTASDDKPRKGWWQRTFG